MVDVTDDTSITSLADRVGPVDHVVSTASARARGKLADLDRKNLQLSFDTKVIGPAKLAKHFAAQMNTGGSFVLFSGVNAFKVNIGYLGVAITNGAVDFLTRSLAVELAPFGSTRSPPTSTPKRSAPCPLSTPASSLSRNLCGHTSPMEHRAQGHESRLHAADLASTGHPSTAKSSNSPRRVTCPPGTRAEAASATRA